MIDQLELRDELGLPLDPAQSLSLLVSADRTWFTCE